MLWNTYFFAAVVSAASLTAQAAGWSQEPESVLGVRLGAPMTDIGIAPCQRSAVPIATGPVCLRLGHPYIDRLVTLEGLPGLGFDYSASISVFEGSAQAVMLQGKQSQWHSLKALLTEKYGSPSTATVETVKTGSGAVLTSERLVWNGAAVDIVAHERANRIDTSYAVFTHLPTQARAAAAKQRTTRDAAGKL